MSHADLVHKLMIALKELNETSVWLRMVGRAKLMKAELLEEPRRRESTVMSNIERID